VSTTFGITADYVPHPPLIVRPAVGGDYFVVLDAAGVPVARGDREMCDLVAAGKVLFVRSADLLSLADIGAALFVGAAIALVPVAWAVSGIWWIVA
jgi:hypothetical protein